MRMVTPGTSASLGSRRAASIWPPMFERLTRVARRPSRLLELATCH
jgi:hypothetical protein